MKTRNGFVSNSSSSSFCIYGTYVEGLKDDVECNDLNTYNGDPNNDNDGMWVGRDWSSIGDNETGAQFKKDVEDKVEKMLGKKQKCDTIQEAWYNG